MTPRSDIVWLNLSESVEESKRKIARHKFSFYPISKDTFENVLGVVKAKDLLSLAMEGRPFDLKQMCHKPLFVSDTTPAVNVMEVFRKSGTHIAFVVNEYGAVLGLVTLDDILRSVFEDFEDTEEGGREITVRDDGSWLISGSLPLDEFTDYMEAGGLTEEERTGINTVGGFVMAKIGAVPSEGQHFEWRRLRFEVLDMDGRRVDKVLVSRIRDNGKAETLNKG
jgi:putative hemolysin